MSKVLTCAILLAMLSATAVADEVLFTNGDRLTGKVTHVEPKRLKLSSDMAGEVTVDLDNVKRFNAEGTLVVLLNDGTARPMRVVLYENGVFHLGEPTTQPTTQPASAPATQAATEPTTEPVDASTSPASLPATGPVTLPTTIPAEPVVAPSGTVRSIRGEELTRMVTPSTRWNGTVSAGATVYRGNTNSEMATLAFSVARRTLDDRIEANGTYNYGRERNPDTGEKFVTANNASVYGEYDYFLSRQWYVYAGGRAEHDRLSNLYLRATPGAGLGYQWIESDRTNINTEAGLNWVYERTIDPHEIDGYVAARAAWQVNHKLNDRVSLTHNFEILPRLDDFSDHVINADAGLRVSVTGHVFTEFRVVLTYDSTPAESQENTDVEYHAVVGYQF